MSRASCTAGHQLSGRGRPCRRCRTELIAARVAHVDSGLTDEQIASAIDAVVSNGATLRTLFRALEVGPEPLLAGAPPVVGRLVMELRDRGSALPEPACVRCGRTERPLFSSTEGGVCPRCRSYQLAEPCTRCGEIRPVVARDPDGSARCWQCCDRPRRRCGICGQQRFIAKRARDGHPDICDGCFRPPVAICGRCGRERPCYFVAAGRPICSSCSPRRTASCAHCGAERPACVRWPEGPVCESCYRAAMSRRGICTDCGTERRLVAPPGPSARLCADCADVPPLATCRSCGAEDRLYRHGRCVRCALAERTRELIGGPDGPLGSVYEAIIAAPQPYSAHNWLRKGAGAAILAELAAGNLPLTHAALDGHAKPRAADFLRQMLVANGVLPARDEELVRLEHWIADHVADITDPKLRQLLRSYATWRILRRIRQKPPRAGQARTSTRLAKTRLLIALAFFEFLHQQGTDLAGCTQAHLDRWLSQGSTSAYEITDFLDWAAQRKLIDRLHIPPRQRRHGPALDDQTRWDIAKRLLHDDMIDLTDRVAGCLVLLYGCQLSRIVAITRDQISTIDQDVFLRLGPAQLLIPQPLGGQLLTLAEVGRKYVGVGTPAQRTWLFPGLDPGRPLHPSSLRQRLINYEIPARSGRRTALLHLASHMPAGVLADLLGIHPTTAVKWTHAAGADWTTYAAQLVKDRDREP